LTDLRAELGRLRHDLHLAGVKFLHLRLDMLEADLRAAQSPRPAAEEPSTKNEAFYRAIVRQVDADYLQLHRRLALVESAFASQLRRTLPQ